MKNIPIHIKYGIYTGLAIVCWMLFEYFMGWHKTATGAMSNVIGYVIFFIGLFLAIKITSEKYLNNQLSLKIGMLIGLQFTLVAAVINFAGVFVYYQFINPDFANFWIAKGTAILQVEKKSAEEIAQYKQGILANYTPIKQSTKSLLFYMLTGTFLSAVITIMFRLFSGIGTNKK